MPAPSSPLLAHLWLALHAPLAARGFHVYVSPHNAGALDFVYEELRHQFDGQLRIAYSQGSIAEYHTTEEKAREELRRLKRICLAQRLDMGD